MAAVSSVHHTLPLPGLSVDKPSTSGTTASHLQKKPTVPPLTPQSHRSQLEEKRGKSPKATQLVEEDESDAERGYYLEQIPADEDDNVDDEEEFEYHEVPIEDFEDLDDEELGEEDLEQAVRNINEKNFLGAFPETTAKPVEAVATLSKRPEVIDDYIRNYLSSKGMTRALEVFQNEWYELQLKGLLSPEDIVIVPDVYQRNTDLEDSVKKLRIDVEEYKEIANKARSTYSKLRKERDFHRMHHKRVVQEKNRLITDIKKLKKHYEGYEPTLKQLQHKYEVAMKERMLVRLERDRLAGKVNSLEILLRQLEKSGKETVPPTPKSPYPASTTSTPPNKPPTSLSRRNTSVKDAVLPHDDRRNPYLGMAVREDAANKAEKLKFVHGFKAHEVAASAIKFHPRKMILATVSDDKTWKMWAFPSGELIMSGDGHKDWIGDCDFHPRGAHLATASGDCTVKVWDFSKGQSTLTLAEHTQAVWSCAFHDQGDFLVSSSMDHTAKLWDLNTGICRQTFRGHADSVNHVIWQPYTNTIVTASADKTVSMWDARAGICTQTLYGHANSVSCTAFTLKADRFASCDASGIIKIWDGRQLDTELETIDFGPHPANKICFDPTGAVIAVASNDGTVKMWNVNDRIKTGRDLNLDGTNGADPVQAVVFDRSGEYLVASGSEGSIGIYS